jgi:tRNA pseudouridine-54 N-methylase
MMTEDSKILRFIQLLPNTPLTTNFSNKDLPGSGKRIDILCRVLAACFDWGPSLLSNMGFEVMAVFGNEMTLTFSNPKDYLPSGEVAWGNEIRNAVYNNPSEYVVCESVGLDEVMNRLLRESQSRVIALIENGDRLTNAFFENTSAQNSFMLGDHRGFDSESLRIIGKEKIQQISLGEMSYLSSHCVATLISKFERFLTNAPIRRYGS